MDGSWQQSKAEIRLFVDAIITELDPDCCRCGAGSESGTPVKCLISQVRNL
jgi:hypothetical protein